MEGNTDNTELLLQENNDGPGTVSGSGLARLAASTVDGGGGGAVTTTTATTTTSASAPVPDVLLSLAKDDRYVSELSSLIARVVAPFASIFPSSSSSSSSGLRARDRVGGVREMTSDDDDDDDGRRLVERIRPELDLLASVIVHSAAYVSCYARGGNFGHDESAARRSLGMESLNLAYRYPAKEGGGVDSPPSSTTLTARGRKERLANRSVGLLPSWKVNRWHALLFLQSVVPYIVQRVGRGGWSKDLGGTVYNLLEQIGLVGIVYPVHAGSRTNHVRDDDGSALRNDDRLRGSARRRLFLEQRRRMVDSANDTSQINADGNSDGSLEEDVSHSRRVRHESEFTSANSVDNDLRTLGSNGLDQRLKRISSVTWNFLSRASLAISSLSNGAYSLSRHASNAANENLDRHAGLMKWLLRLHLALFYWNGMYPTLAHRLVGAKIQDGVVPIGTGSSHSTMTGAIVANRPTYKPIAAIILFQAIAALSKTTVEASIEVAHFIQVSFFRWRRRRRIQQQRRQHRGGNLTSDEIDFPSVATNSERTEYMEMIEDRVPGISSSEFDATAEMHQSPSDRQKKTGQRGHQCGICLNERVHPAAPSACGHVFCWDCVLHWVSNVRAECPLCRAETRPQDIIPLYNYP